MSKQLIKLAGVVAAVGIIAFIMWSIFVSEVGATVKPFTPVTLCHDAGGKKFVEITVSTQGALNGHEGHDGDIIPMPEGGCPVEEEPVDVCPNDEGTQTCEKECTVPEPIDYCDRLDGVQSEPCPTEPTCEELNNCPVPTCEELNNCPVPTCEELNNCPVEPEEPVVPPVVKKEVKNPNLEYSQGPNGNLGDSCVQFEWSTIKGSKDVRIKVSTDLQGMAFGKKYTVIETKDDGAETVCFPGAKQGIAKIRGDDSDTEYSDVEKFKL